MGVWVCVSSEKKGEEEGRGEERSGERRQDVGMESEREGEVDGEKEGGGHCSALMRRLLLVSLARQRKKKFPSPTSTEIIANWTGSCLLPPTHTLTHPD